VIRLSGAISGPKDTEFGADAMVTRYHPGGMTAPAPIVNRNLPSCAISAGIGFPLPPRSGSGLNTTIPPASGCPWNETRPCTVVLIVGATRLHPIGNDIKTIARPIDVPEICNRIIVAKEHHRFQVLRYSSTFSRLLLQCFVAVPSTKTAFRVIEKVERFISSPRSALTSGIT
jgi:hypothetical protein